MACPFAAFTYAQPDCVPAASSEQGAAAPAAKASDAAAGAAARRGDGMFSLEGVSAIERILVRTAIFVKRLYFFLYAEH